MPSFPLTAYVFKAVGTTANLVVNIIGTGRAVLGPRALSAPVAATVSSVQNKTIKDLFGSTPNNVADAAVLIVKDNPVYMGLGGQSGYIVTDGTGGNPDFRPGANDQILYPGVYGLGALAGSAPFLLLDDADAYAGVGGGASENLGEFGTAGIPSVDVYSIQGVAGMEPVSVRQGHDYIDVNLTVPTGLVDAGDLLAESQIIAGIVSRDDLPGRIVAMSLLDIEDQTEGGLDVYFLKANVSFGAENSPPSISDVNGAHIVGCVRVLSTDWRDLGGCKYAYGSLGSGMPFLPVPGSDDLYVAVVTQSNRTHAGGVILLRLWIKE